MPQKGLPVNDPIKIMMICKRPSEQTWPPPASWSKELSNRRDDLSLLSPVEAHGVHRLQNLQQSPGDDLVIAAGVGGNFSGGGNILVVIGGSRVFSTKRHLHPFRIHIYFWHLHPVLVVVCSVHVRVRARERCQWMVNVILRELHSYQFHRCRELPCQIVVVVKLSDPIVGSYTLVSPLSHRIKVRILIGSEGWIIKKN